MIHLKRILIGTVVIVFVTFLIIGVSFSFVNNISEAPPDLLTTNIDFHNKTINGTTSEDVVVDKKSLDFSIIADLYQSVLETLSSLSIYQGFASLVPGVPKKEFIKIYPGERKEQITEKLARQFSWSTRDKLEFQNAFAPINVTNDGYYYPGFYSTPSNATSKEIREMLFDRFNKNVLNRYPTTTNEQVPLTMAITIASIIEREAAGKEDMPLVSGVIWNRIFIGMNLQVDATLQYAKGKKGNWWPKVFSKDKYIKSIYNTYQHSGLPPSPISNVSLASLQAALNPVKTDCLFYLHDAKRTFRCSPTYAGHLENIKNYLK